MRILAIETSCDETAISILEADGGFDRPKFKILAHLISSQIDIHQAWGGVVPNIAKREHGKALVPLLKSALKDAGLYHEQNQIVNENVGNILEREPELLDSFRMELFQIAPPEIDAIAITYGPGLEPALWVGINFAKALSLIWNKPVIPMNHMEGHLFSALVKAENNDELRLTNDELEPKNYIEFPAIALLVSGGHTEIILVKNWHEYEVIGRTRDDAVGEAFDKVARLLGLPYPGGPEISKLAAEHELLLRSSSPKSEDSLRRRAPKYTLPRPMIKSGDFDFSFSGLKTAVLYLVKKIEPLTDDDKKAIAWEFQNAALDVLIEKTLSAIEHYGAMTLIVGGGVIANKQLKERLKDELAVKFPDTILLLPNRDLSTDNATMIAIAAYFRSLKENFSINPEIRAKGNLSL